MTTPLPPNTLDDTFSGMPVQEYASDELINFYRDMFWPDENRQEADQLFAWLHQFNDTCLSARDTLQPLFKSAFRVIQHCGKMQLAAIVIIGVHYREPWLYRRLTNNALSYIGRVIGDQSSVSFSAFVLTVKQQLEVRLKYKLRDVFEEIDLRRRIAQEETSVITRAQLTDTTKDTE